MAPIRDIMKEVLMPRVLTSVGKSSEAKRLSALKAPEMLIFPSIARVTVSHFRSGGKEWRRQGTGGRQGGGGTRGRGKEREREGNVEKEKGNRRRGGRERRGRRSRIYQGMEEGKEQEGRKSNKGGDNI